MADSKAQDEAQKNDTETRGGKTVSTHQPSKFPRHSRAKPKREAKGKGNIDERKREGEKKRERGRVGGGKRQREKKEKKKKETEEKGWSGGVPRLSEWVHVPKTSSSLFFKDCQQMEPDEITNAGKRVCVYASRPTAYRAGNERGTFTERQRHETEERRRWLGLILKFFFEEKRVRTVKPLFPFFRLLFVRSLAQTPRASPKFTQQCNLAHTAMAAKKKRCIKVRCSL